MAVDGKQLRGTGAGGGKAVWLIAAMDRAGTVIAQGQVDARSNETPAFIPLLDGLASGNTVVTADAAHTQHANGPWLRERDAHYIAVVKRNHPSLHKQLKNLPRADVPVDHKDRTRAGAAWRSATSGPSPSGTSTTPAPARPCASCAGATT